MGLGLGLGRPLRTGSAKTPSAIGRRVGTPG